jgi:hypothetical protein
MRLNSLNSTPNEKKRKREKEKKRKREKEKKRKREKAGSCKVLRARTSHGYAVKDWVRPVPSATSGRTRAPSPTPLLHTNCPPYPRPRTTTLADLATPIPDINTLESTGLTPPLHYSGRPFYGSGSH